jgi:hypothetical protein
MNRFLLKISFLLCLPAPSDIWNSQDTSKVLDEHKSGGTEGWLNANIKSSVPVEQTWASAIFLKVL